MTKRIIIESPYAGDVQRNVFYARLCMKHALMQGEAPFASHLLYTQPKVLDDDKPDERSLGIAAGFMWHECAELVAVYTDLGISNGMHQGIHNAEKLGIPIEYRICPEWNRINNMADLPDFQCDGRTL